MTSSTPRPYFNYNPKLTGKIAALLSLVAALIGTTGVIGTLGTVYSRQSGAIAAAILLSCAAVVLCTGLVLVVLVILPMLHRPGGPPGTLIEVADLKDPATTRAYYLKAALDPLAHHAATAWMQNSWCGCRRSCTRRFSLCSTIVVTVNEPRCCCGWR